MLNVASSVATMSGFELLPIDGGDAIVLPRGQTVLGRGPFLRVSDKRVSRHHGLLDSQDGRLRLKPTHVNPCFLQSSVADDPRPLQRDAWFPLDHGDIFSLLPGQLMFRVAAAGARTLDGPLGQSLACEEAARAGSRQRSPAPPPGRHGVGPQASACETPLAGETLDKEAALSGLAAASPPPRNKRLLPSWMTTAVKTSAATSRQAAQTIPKRVPVTCDVSASEESQRSRLGQDRDKSPQVKRGRKEEGARADVPLAEDDERPRRVDHVAAETQQEDHGRRRAATGKRAIAAGTSDVTLGTSDVAASGRQNASSKAKKEDKSPSGARTACPYGKDCYRKNPLHFQECSHPGDADFQEEEEEEERPECPYGADCYRKNPLHRKQYKHTKTAARSRRAAAKAGAAGAAGAASDPDSDSGDSFIHDDDSEDVDADSDYAPPPGSD
ncbi:aprataxin and PNK-like factor isoform X2 [Vanacampus margaritifer]